jgi:hypothetical protein
LCETGNMKFRNIAVMFATVAVMTGSVVAPAAFAQDPYSMKPQELEQAVLRAQMPTTLGAWTQNYYFDETDIRFTKATICWGSKGAVTLPGSKIVGSVGYAINQNTMGSVSIFQFKDQSAADRALKSLRNADCADTPRVPTEDGTLVKGSSGSDLTDSSRTGLEAGQTHIEDGMRAYQDVITTFRGLSAVQTQVSRYVKLPQTMKQQQTAVNKLSRTNKQWHKKALNALEAFGSGNAR